MRLIQLGLARTNPTVGRLRTNTDRLIEFALEMGKSDVTVGVFPEQAISGYPAEDLVQWGRFVEAQRVELERFASETKAFSTVYAVGLTVGVAGELYNVAALVHRGSILAFVPKEKLPTYNVFYEARTFSRGGPGLELEASGVPLGDYIFQFDFGTLALEVCEDIWSADGPMKRRCYSGAELVCNLSASPFRAGQQATRRELLATRSADHQTTIAYCNLVGANDGLVFDGGGFVHQNGRPILEAPRFSEGISVATVDLDRTTRSRREATTWRSDLEIFRSQELPIEPLRFTETTAKTDALAYPPPAPGTSYFLPAASGNTLSPRDAWLDELFEVLTLGVADYYLKTGCFRSIGIALSGGRDSALTAVIAWKALERIPGGALHTFFMSTRYSSHATRMASEALAKELGAAFLALSIDQELETELAAQRAMLEGTEPSALSIQNTQARIRASRMWNWANSSGALFLQTGNMSEKALGYTTVAGDLEGALSVIANLPKTVVNAMLERLRVRFGLASIDKVLATVPGPELAENQSGENELMPYDVLDACLYLYVGEKLSLEDLAHALASSFPDRGPEALKAWSEKFVRLFTQSIFKWVRAPLCLHVGALDLDRERALQLPVVQKREW